ncbi:MAG: hypothetical protein K1X83_06610 [Oligoflexia bacterium]|nr:hypothetical protein [Oligoflexia bacterium]
MFPRSNSILCTSGLILIALVLCGGDLHLWNAASGPLLLRWRYGLLLGGLLCGYAVFRERSMPALDPAVLSIIFPILLVSGWLTRPYNLLQGPSIRGEIIIISLACFYMLRHKQVKVLVWAPLLTSLLLAGCFYVESSGRPIFSDDNATFIYRLALLDRIFPHIPFYGPLWNAGIDVRDFFATGALNVFFLFYPLIRLLGAEHAYDLIVTLLLFVLLPASVWTAARLERMEKLGAAIAAILALSSSLLWYRWALKYGTLGFITTATLAPLNMALLLRVISRDTVIERWMVIVGMVSISLMLCWTPAALLFLPFGLFGLLRLRALLRKRGFLVLLIGLIALNLPWIAVFWRVSDVSSFFSSGKAAYHSSATGAELVQARRHVRPVTLKATLSTIKDFATSSNPVLVLLLLPGVFYLRPRSRAPFLAMIAWSLLLGCIVAQLKPQLELERALVMMLLWGALPAAAAVLQILRWAESERGSLARISSAALLCGFMLSAPLSSAAVLRNRTTEQYYFASPLVHQLADAINEYGGAGRVLFSGFVLHELNGGHLAPLTLWSSKPLMASSHLHNMWKYRQIFPGHYLELGDDGIEQFLNLYNVSAVIAHEADWKKRFNAQPDRYQSVWRGGKFELFQRLRPAPGYFLEGQGAIISQQDDRVRFTLESSEAVLKFNFLPFVRVDGCEVAPREYPGGIKLIELRGCPVNRELELRSINAAERLWGSY